MQRREGISKRVAFISGFDWSDNGRQKLPITKSLAFGYFWLQKYLKKIIYEQPSGPQPQELSEAIGSITPLVCSS